MFNFEQALEPDSVLSFLECPAMFDYLRLLPEEELTSHEKEIRAWLRIEGYWPYLQSLGYDGIGKIVLIIPDTCCRQRLKDKAVKILETRFHDHLRLMTLTELDNLRPDPAPEVTPKDTSFYCEKHDCWDIYCECEKEW